MKKAMVIGAGRGQIPLIDLFHKYGYYVICVSIKGNYPGFSIADDCVYKDVKNKEDILECAQEARIEAIATDQLDVAVPTVAYIAEKMKLKGIGYETSLRFTNKYLMKQAAVKSGINVPKNEIASTLDEAIEKSNNFQFPIMLKPVDSDASRGVFKINSLDELSQHFEYSQSYSKDSQVILEQYIKGIEYVVEAFTQNYEPRNLVVGHRDYFNIENTFIPCATVFVDADSASSELEVRLKDINQRLIKALGLPFGITHAEYLYNDAEDKIYLVEIAARGGGVFISSDLIPNACGVNANELLVRELTGLPIEVNTVLKKGASAYFCYLTPEGKVCKFENTDDIEKIHGVDKAFFDNIELGMTTASIRDKSSRKGPILVSGLDKAECYEIISKVKETLDIKVKTIDGVKDIIWN